MATGDRCQEYLQSWQGAGWCAGGTEQWFEALVFSVSFRERLQKTQPEIAGIRGCRQEGSARTRTLIAGQQETGKPINMAGAVNLEIQVAGRGANRHFVAVLVQLVLLHCCEDGEAL